MCCVYVDVKLHGIVALHIRKYNSVHWGRKLSRNADHMVACAANVKSRLFHLDKYCEWVRNSLEAVESNSRHSAKHKILNALSCFEGLNAGRDSGSPFKHHLQESNLI